jgi:hypothetical protein
LPENILGHFEKYKDHASVYLFDQGQWIENMLGEHYKQAG